MHLCGFLRRGGAPPHRGYHLVATDEAALLMLGCFSYIPGALPDRPGSERQDLRANGNPGLTPSEAELSRDL